MTISLPMCVQLVIAVALHHKFCRVSRGGGDYSCNKGLADGLISTAVFNRVVSHFQVENEIFFCFSLSN